MLFYRHIVRESLPDKTTKDIRKSRLIHVAMDQIIAAI